MTDDSPTSHGMVPGRHPRVPAATSSKRVAGARSAIQFGALALLLTACALPVRLATRDEIKQASATPSPAVPASQVEQAITASPDATPAAPSAGSGALSALQAEITSLAGRTLPSVVEVDTASGLGSGIVVDTSGDIVTNAHVVGGDRTFTVDTSDGRQLPATLVGTYPANDLAVIKVAATSNLKPLTFADSSKVRVGNIVLAIGSPLGLFDSVSEGIVSGVHRAQSEGNGVNLTDLIQITAGINPGNSGGALIDINGQVIGIPTLAQGSGRGGAASNIAFAISSNQVVNVTKQLIASGSVTHTNQPYLGVTVGAGPNGEALIDSVVSGGPAATAGTKAGWVITGMGTYHIASPEAVTETLSDFKPGDKVAVTFKLPDGTSKTLSVTLGERPVSP